MAEKKKGKKGNKGQQQNPNDDSISSSSDLQGFVNSIKDNNGDDAPKSPRSPKSPKRTKKKLAPISPKLLARAREVERRMTLQGNNGGATVARPRSVSPLRRVATGGQRASATGTKTGAPLRRVVSTAGQRVPATKKTIDPDLLARAREIEQRMEREKALKEQAKDGDGKTASPESSTGGETPAGESTKGESSSEKKPSASEETEETSEASSTIELPGEPSSAAEPALTEPSAEPALADPPAAEPALADPPVPEPGKRPAGEGNSSVATEPALAEPPASEPVLAETPVPEPANSFSLRSTRGALGSSVSSAVSECESNIVMDPIDHEDETHLSVSPFKEEEPAEVELEEIQKERDSLKGEPFNPLSSFASFREDMQTMKDKRGSSLFDVMDKDNSNTAEHGEMTQFLSSNSSLWVILSLNFHMSKDKSLRLVTEVAMELATGLTGEEAWNSKLTKMQFKQFRQNYIVDPAGSQEFFLCAVFATFDTTKSGTLDKKQVDEFLDVFYKSCGIYQGTLKLPPQGKLRKSLLNKFVDDKLFRLKKIPFDEVRLVIRTEAKKVNGRGSSTLISFDETEEMEEEEEEQAANEVVESHEKQDWDFCDWIEHKTNRRFCSKDGGNCTIQ